MDIKIQNIIDRSNLKEFVSASELAEVANYFLRENPKLSLNYICNILNISPRTFSDKLLKEKIKKLSKKGLYILSEESIENNMDLIPSSNKILENQIEQNQKEKDNPIKEELSQNWIKESNDLGNERLKILINSIEKSNSILEEINSKLTNKNNSRFENKELNLELEEDETYFKNISYNKIPNIFEYLRKYVNQTTERLFMRRTFQYNPDAFEMFLKAYKKQGITQKEAISQALFLYAYIYLTKDELESVELLSEVNYDSYSNDTSFDS